MIVKAIHIFKEKQTYILRYLKSRYYIFHLNKDIQTLGNDLIGPRLKKRIEIKIK